MGGVGEIGFESYTTWEFRGLRLATCCWQCQYMLLGLVNFEFRTILNCFDWMLPHFFTHPCGQKYPQMGSKTNCFSTKYILFQSKTKYKRGLSEKRLISNEWLADVWSHVCKIHCSPPQSALDSASYYTNEHIQISNAIHNVFIWKMRSTCH